MKRIPNIAIPFKGSDFTIEVLVIAALMRELEVKNIDLDSLNLKEPGGMIFYDRHIELQEKEDVADCRG